MAIVVILLLAVLWAVVLLPPILRSRASAGSGGVSDFMDGLRALGRHGDHRSSSLWHGPARPQVRPIAPPMTGPLIRGAMSPAQKRRRDVLFTLGGVCGFLFLVAVMMGSTIAWLLWLVSVAALAGYCYLLVQLKHRTHVARPVGARRAEVRPLHARPLAAAPVANNVVLLRRSAGGY